MLRFSFIQRIAMGHLILTPGNINVVPTMGQAHGTFFFLTFTVCSLPGTLQILSKILTKFRVMDIPSSIFHVRKLKLSLAP